MVLVVVNFENLFAELVIIAIAFEVDVVLDVVEVDFIVLIVIVVLILV